MENIPDDHELLLMMSSGDKSAFETIYRKYWHELYVAAGRRLNNAAQAEDIVQNVFIRLWERRAVLQISNLSAWLHTAVKYQVYNYIARDAVAESFYEPLENITACSSGADARANENELLTLINAYIRALPSKKRMIFTLYYQENLSTAEIAQRLNISRKTVQNQIGTAMNALRAELLPEVFIAVGLLLTVIC